MLSGWVSSGDYFLDKTEAFEFNLSIISFFFFSSFC